mgnify:FL=1
MNKKEIRNPVILKNIHKNEFEYRYYAKINNKEYPLVCSSTTKTNKEHRKTNKEYIKSNKE